jgi:hypothetical protein
MSKAAKLRSVFADALLPIFGLTRTFVRGAQLFGLVGLVMTAVILAPLVFWLLFQLLSLLVVLGAFVFKLVASAVPAWEAAASFDPWSVGPKVFVILGGAYGAVCLVTALLFAFARWFDPQFERRSGPLDFMRRNIFFANGALGALAGAPFLSLALHELAPSTQYFSDAPAMTWTACWLFWVEHSQSVLTLSLPGVSGFDLSALTAGGVAAYHVWAVKVICYSEIASRFVAKIRDVDAREVSDLERALRSPR